MSTPKLNTVKGSAPNTPAGGEPPPAPGIVTTATPAAEPAAVAMLSGAAPDTGAAAALDYAVLPWVAQQMDKINLDRAAQWVEAHRRFSRLFKIHTHYQSVLPMDVLGVYVRLPEVPAAP